MSEPIERPELRITGPGNGEALSFELVYEPPDDEAMVVLEVGIGGSVLFRWPLIQRMAEDQRLSVRALAVALLAARESGAALGYEFPYTATL